MLRLIARLRFVCVAFAHRFMRDGRLATAAALTYTTLFAVVPLMTVTYAVLSVLPDFATIGRDIEAYIFANFVPTAGEQLREQLFDFAQQAKGLTWWGSALLLVTSYLLLVNVEKAFNDIWGIAEPRKGVARFTLYWGILTFGPPAIALATAISSYLLSQPWIEGLPQLAVRSELLGVLPWVISGALFTALFYAVPNCAVPLGHALIGGLVTMLGFHLALRLFGSLVAGSGVQIVYGAFAAAPLFLSWIYLCWCIVLGGALLVKLLGEPVHDPRRNGVPKLLGAIRLLRELLVRHREGRGLPHAEAVRALDGVARGAGLLQRLQQSGWIVRSDRSDWRLGRDLATVSLWDLAVLLDSELGWSADWQGLDPLLATRIDRALSSARGQLDVTLETVLTMPR